MLRKNACACVAWMLPAAMAAGLGALPLLSGCSAWSSYPEIETRPITAFSEPTSRPVTIAMAEAITYTRQVLAPNQDLAVNLPPGTPAESYEIVFERTGAGGRPMREVNEPAIHITQVRTRGAKAEVDLIYPRQDGLNQFITLMLSRGPFEKYKVTDSRPWQLRNVQAPKPNYQPPPPPKAE